MLAEFQRFAALAVVVNMIVGCSSHSMPRVPAAARVTDGTELKSREELRVGSISSVQEGPPVTDEEALAVGTAITIAIGAGDVDGFCDAFDWNAFGAIIVAGLPNDTPEAEMYRESTAKSVRNGGVTIANRLIDEVAIGGSADVLRARDTDIGKCVVVRYVSCLANFGQSSCLTGTVELSFERGWSEVVQ